VVAKTHQMEPIVMVHIQNYNMKDFWNNRYSDAVMAYGEAPNQFLKTQLQKLKVGEILLPAEGEGRNAVYAAKQGWNATAFDISEQGKKKADRLAITNNVTIDYEVGGVEDVSYPKESFDCIGLIFAHFPAALKTDYHKILDTYLRKGGYVIFEAFSKNHLAFNLKDPKVGGPKKLEMLFSKEEIERDFSNYEIIKLSEEQINLAEGAYHKGTSSVIRFVGRKC